jgi:peptidoglycan/xylan/chitin deacetylase (PgdA/CDA1 family)
MIAKFQVFVKSLAQRALQVSGALHFFRLKNSRRFRILTYHHFDAASAGEFELQCRHIRRHYHPVSLDDVAALIRDGKSLPPNAIALTVDDGYKDFYQHAYPCLRKYGIPTTMYLITGFLDGTVEPWWDRLREAYRDTPLETNYEQAAEQLKSLPQEERLDFIDRLPKRGALPPPVAWDEVREMSRNGVTFGAHTQSHPILSTLATDSEIRAEVEGSRDRIADELGCPVAHFCYPNGKTCDFDERVVRIVQNAGFQTAVSTERGFNTSDDDPFALRRIGAEPDMPKFYFARQLAGWL